MSQPANVTAPLDRLKERLADRYRIERAVPDHCLVGRELSREPTTGSPTAPMTASVTWPFLQSETTSCP